MKHRIKPVFYAYVVTPMIALGLYTASVSLLQAEPAAGEAGDHPGMRPPHPALALLDANEDGVLSALEIDAAPTVLRMFDTDNDGALTLEELESALPPPPRMAGGRGPEGHGGPGAQGGRGGFSGMRGDAPPMPRG